MSLLHLFMIHWINFQNSSLKHHIKRGGWAAFISWSPLLMFIMVLSPESMANPEMPKIESTQLIMFAIAQCIISILMGVWLAGVSMIFVATAPGLGTIGYNPGRTILQQLALQACLWQFTLAVILGIVSGLLVFVDILVATVTLELSLVLSQVVIVTIYGHRAAQLKQTSS